MKGSNRRRVVAGAAAVAAVVGTGAAVGATQWSPQAENDAILADVAAQLGVEPDELEGAIEQALEDRLDEAVAAGRMTQEQADALKERIESGDFPLFGGGGPGGPGGMHGGGPIGLDAAASYLGLTDEELRTELSDGSTLAEVAGEQGKSVDGLVAALVESAKADLADAVEAGRLTEAQQAEILDGLEERITTLVNEGFRGGHGPGGFPGGPGGPPPRRLGLGHERLDELVRFRGLAVSAGKGGPSLQPERRAVALPGHVGNSAQNRRACVTDTRALPRYRRRRVAGGPLPSQGGARASN